jgi:hypothetical protein
VDRVLGHDAAAGVWAERVEGLQCFLPGEIRVRKEANGVAGARRPRVGVDVTYLHQHPLVEVDSQNENLYSTCQFG